jgi:hypothetical protein
MFKMTKASDLYRDLNQLGQILRDGETVDGTQVQWDDDAALNNIVETLVALDADALEALATDVGIDLREANASAERLCAELQADRGQNSDGDPGPTGPRTFSLERAVSTWVDHTSAVSGGLTLAVGGLFATHHGKCVDSANFMNFGAHWFEADVSSLDGVYAFRGVNTSHSGAGTSECASPARRGGVLATLGTPCPHHGATATTSTTAREFFPNREFSLVGQVFDAVCQHLREEQEHGLKKHIEALRQWHPVIVVVDDGRAKARSEGSTGVAIHASRCMPYPVYGLNQLVAAIDTQNGRGRLNRRARD